MKTAEELKAMLSNPAIAKMAGQKTFDSNNNWPRYGRYRYEVLVAKHKHGTKGLSYIAELKVVKAEKSLDPKAAGIEPQQVGEVVCYIEKGNDDAKGGGGRFKVFLMKAAGQTAEAISTFTATVQNADGTVVQKEISGDNAQALWLAKVINETTQPLAFMLVDCEVYPKDLPPKDGRPGITLSGYRWSTVDPSDDEYAAILAKRAAANLPALDADSFAPKF